MNIGLATPYFSRRIDFCLATLDILVDLHLLPKWQPILYPLLKFLNLQLFPHKHFGAGPFNQLYNFSSTS